MRLLIVGAGATYAEAVAAGLPPEQQPPLMFNFADRMWREYSPGLLLSSYLDGLGQAAGGDPRPIFAELARQSPETVNVERFFEHAYQLRNVVLPGHELFDPPSLYDNLLLHGVLGPLSFILGEGLLKGAPEEAELPLARSVAGQLEAGDLVLNLNYDTVFEIAAEQAGHSLAFLPNAVGAGRPGDQQTPRLDQPFRR